MKQFLVRHIGMLERRCVSIELFPIRFGDEMLHVLEQGGTGKRSQHLKESATAIQFD